jgi:fatty acid desaturase
MKLFRAGNPHMFWLFLISWSAVHLGFEWEFWLGGGAGVFGKYQDTKATWMFALVWLQVLGLPLRSAVAWSFLVYGIQLLLFFPVQIYSVLNVLLALGCVGEDLILRRRENGRHRRAG